MSDEWLNFIAECRAGKIHEYDIVEGPMADDTIWDYVEDIWQNGYLKLPFGNWLSLNIQLIRLSSAHREHCGQ